MDEWAVMGLSKRRNGGLGSFVALDGGPVPAAAQANGRDGGARGRGEGEEDELHGRSCVLLGIFRRSSSGRGVVNSLCE